MGERNSIKRICVFCGSNHGARSSYTNAAQQLGKALVSHEKGLVYGGGSIGPDDRRCRRCSEEKGEVIGVIPHALFQRVCPLRSDGTSPRIEHARAKVRWRNFGASLQCSGGFGTLDEFFEIVTWARNWDRIQSRLDYFKWWRSISPCS